MTTKSHVGKSVYYATSAPATNNAAGFEALTWIKIPGYMGGFQFGMTHADIDAGDLEQGEIPTIRGMASFQESTGTFRNRSGDMLAAQETFKGLVEAGIVPAIKIVRGTGVAMDDGGKAPATGDQTEYCQGYFKSPVDMEQSPTTHEGFSVAFKQNAVAVKAAHPTVT